MQGANIKTNFLAVFEEPPGLPGAKKIKQNKNPSR
jgi:hypothetical protein